jgi:hypothetical protein
MDVSIEIDPVEPSQSSIGASKGYEPNAHGSTDQAQDMPTITADGDLQTVARQSTFNWIISKRFKL